MTATGAFVDPSPLPAPTPAPLSQPVDALAPLSNRAGRLLELQGVSHRYGRHQALSGVDLTLAGGTIGLIGQNGAGKSTLLKILMGLVRPTQGEGKVLGHSIRGSGRILRRRVGFMPEADAFLPGVAGVTLVALAGQLSGMPRLQAQRRAHEVLSHLGLDEVCYRKAEEYSFGMRQRLKLACALVHDPELLLLDEPTAGLDPKGRDEMLALLSAISRRHGKSLILSTHLLGDIEKLCDEVVIVDRGKILGVGAIDSLRARWRGRFRLRWLGTETTTSATTLIDALVARGVRVLQQPAADTALVDVPEGWSNATFFVLAHAAGLTLCDVVPQTEELDDLYHRLISGTVPLAGTGSAPGTMAGTGASP